MGSMPLVFAIGGAGAGVDASLEKGGITNEETNYELENRKRGRASIATPTVRIS
jgi:hypothetical protein